DLGQGPPSMGPGRVFEVRLVRPFTGYVLLAGLLAAWLRGWPILGFLQGGKSNWVLAAILIYLTLIPLIVFVFLPRGRVFRRAYDEAIARGQVTPELTAALSDRWVWAARGYEWVMIATLAFLMVAK